MTSVMASSATDAVLPIVHRLPDVTGDQEKQNDLILCSLDRPISSALIFFGGDVQVAILYLFCLYVTALVISYGSNVVILERWNLQKQAKNTLVSNHLYSVDRFRVFHVIMA